MPPSAVKGRSNDRNPDDEKQENGSETDVDNGISIFQIPDSMFYRNHTSGCEENKQRQRGRDQYPQGQIKPG